MSIENLESAKYVISMRENPHPMWIIIGVLVFQFIVYLFWSKKMKVQVEENSPAGEWASSSLDKINITHNKSSGHVSMQFGDSPPVMGIFSDNRIQVNDKNYILYDDILFVDSPKPEEPTQYYRTKIAGFA